MKYIQNALSNKNYPIIEAVAKAEYDGWVQIVDTDSESENGKWKHFVDYDPKITKFPIYTYNKVFYDAPQWTVANGEKLTWRARTFPVKIVENRITKIGKGFSWGFIAEGDKIQMFEPVEITENKLLLNIDDFGNNINTI